MSNKSHGLPVVISLFSGAGGLDLGFKQSGFRIILAIDQSEAAIKSHKRNFKLSKSLVGNLVTLGPKGVAKELLKIIQPGSRIGIIGGPPCQGFSRANTNSAVDDPRNDLPKLYVEIIHYLQRIYQIEFVVFENVLGIRDQKHAIKYKSLISSLKSIHFNVHEHSVSALDHNVPQDRKRIIIAAVRKGQNYTSVKIYKRIKTTKVREVIAGLPEPVFFARKININTIPVHPNHWTMRPKSKRFQTDPANWTVSRSFKLLKWDKASPTIAFGNREIHVHPNGKRRLSIYEAMLLQGFPPQFVLEGNLSEQVEQVSNAVPPPLACSIAESIIRSLKG